MIFGCKVQAMSRDKRTKRGYNHGTQFGRYQFGGRSSGAESLDWRKPFSETSPEPQYGRASTPNAHHSECAEFLLKGWSEFQQEKVKHGNQVKTYEEVDALPRNPPINIPEWIEKNSTTPST